MTAPTLDLLAALHKALRCELFDLLVQVGRLDVSDRADVQRCTRQLQRLLALLNEAPGALAELLLQVQRGPLEQREAAAHALYMALTERSIGLLQRLAQEYDGHQTQAAAPAEDQAAQRQRRLASLSDTELREAMHWLGRALTPQELAALLVDLQAATGSEGFGLALDALGASLDAARWDQLAQAMGIPQVTLPGAASREVLALAA